MRVIGTAGHVDHGKSTLIAALTGTHPDRLIEEQKREMTIELGFAWLQLPGGEEIGIVDVPGHRDFIGNMLAGVGGIDAVMLVIAADEGVMPQTREHLAILDLLQISTGIIVISKIDLIEDPEWLDLVELDIQNIVSETTLSDAPIVRVSSRKKIGMENLLTTLEEILNQCPDRVDYGRPRLPIDRVFSIAGFGTVVTGTLLDGSFFTGEEIQILPRNKKGRIRGLQNHKNKEEQASPGSRTAINISGINVEEIQRGDMVVHRHQYKPSRLIDVSVKLLPDISAPIKHGTEVKIFIGTSEIMAKIRLLGTEKLENGQQGWLQLQLYEPAIAVRGDRFIIRRPSPGETIGGGVVVEPFPKSRHKRFSTETIDKLETLLKGSPSDILFNACSVNGPGSILKIIQKTSLDQTEMNSAFQDLLKSGKLISLDGEYKTDSIDGTVITKDQLASITDQIGMIIDNFHRNFPLKPGVAKEELKSRLKLETPVFNLIMSRLNAENKISDQGSIVKRPEFSIQFSEGMDTRKKELMVIFSKNPYSPPSVKDCINIVGEDIFMAMIQMGDLIKVSSDVVFNKKDYESLVSKTKSFISNNGQISVAEARDLFNTSRKYVLALLEYLDSKGITIRVNDVRRLRK
jgi:selenocysteine-specific elongation factor